jgi:hypothetical protein
VSLTPVANAKNLQSIFMKKTQKQKSRYTVSLNDKEVEEVEGEGVGGVGGGMSA